MIRAHQCSADYTNSKEQEALGRSKGELKYMHLLMHWEILILTPGQRNEITQAEALMKNIYNSTIVADKGYMLLFESKGCEVVIPPKRNRKMQRFYDKHIYKERKCFFSKIKNSRRIFSRFDKTAEVFIGFLNFVGALICMASLKFCPQSLGILLPFSI